MLPYSGNLSRLKTDFTVLGQFVKVLTAKILIECGGRVTISGHVNNNGCKLSYPQTIIFHNLQKFYPRKSDFSAICESFHPRKRFPLYSIYTVGRLHLIQTPIILADEYFYERKFPDLCLSKGNILILLLYRRLGLSSACGSWDNSKNICAT